MAEGYRQQMPTEFQFFADCWNYFGKFHEVKDSDKYWEAAVGEAEAINKKYHNPLCKDILIAISRELQRRAEKKEGEA